MSPTTLEKLEQEKAVMIKFWTSVSKLIAYARNMTPATEEQHADCLKTQKEFAELFEHNQAPLEEKDVTPYIHLLACHLHFYLSLEPHRSLGIFMQQAAEAINFLLKKETNRTSRRGGLGSTTWAEQIFNSLYLLPIMAAKYPETFPPAHFIPSFPQFDDALVSAEKRKKNP